MQKPVPFGAHILRHSATSFHIFGGRSATVSRSEFCNYASCRRRGTFFYDFLFDKLPVSEEQESYQRCHRDTQGDSPVCRERSAKPASTSISCSRSQPEKDCSSQTHPVSVIVIAPVLVPFVCTFPLRFSRK